MFTFFHHEKLMTELNLVLNNRNLQTRKGE